MAQDLGEGKVESWAVIEYIGVPKVLSYGGF